MPRATLVVEADLDEDGTYEATLTANVKSADIFIGRSDEMDAAESASLRLDLDNSAGTFTPKTTTYKTGLPIRVRSTAPSSVNLFTGWITNISVDPRPSRQAATIRAMDSMEILRRTVVNQRLLLNQPTGLIIERLLDACERGEFVTNPSFDEDTTGYGSLGAATMARSTSDPFFEAPAALLVSNLGASGDGVRGTVTANTTAGQRVSVSAFTAPGDDTAQAKIVGIRIADSHATGALSTYSLPGESSYIRISVSGTYNASSTQRFIDIVRQAGAGTWKMLVDAVHGVPTKAAIPRNIETGRTRLPYFGPFQAIAMTAIDLARDNELGGLFYFDGGGTAVYEERTHRWETAIPLATVSETFYSIDYEDDFQDRFSKVEFRHAKFDVGAASSYIWTLELPTSRLLSKSGTVTIQAPFGFVAKDLIKPVANTDWRTNTLPDGSGSDMSGSVTLTWKPYGEGATLQLVNNNSSVDAWITQLAIRGTPIRLASDLPLAEYTPTSPPTLTSVLTHDYDLNDGAADGIVHWAHHLGEHFMSQRERVSVALRPRDNTVLTQMLTRKVSDRVKLVNTAKTYSSKINGDYYIEAVRHRIRDGAFLHETIWTVTPVEANAFWILNDSTYGVLGSTTRLAP